MIRYYLSPIREDATENVCVLLESFPGVSRMWWPPIRDDNGRPRWTWCLCEVDRADHTALMADTRLRSLPGVEPDTPLSAVSAQRRNTLNTRLQELGFDTSGFTLQTTVRQVFVELRRQLALRMS